jgi:hypothetical protein
MDHFPKIQFNVKMDGIHLLNIASDWPREFWSLVADCVENAELLKSAARALEGTQKPDHSQSTHQTFSVKE